MLAERARTGTLLKCLPTLAEVAAFAASDHASAMTGAIVAKFAAKYGDEVAAVVKGADEAAGTFRIGRNALFWTDDGGWKTVRFVSRRPPSVKTTSLRASVNVC
jgi:hypothetical protein